jgi:RNA polymerase sigma factor (sigma-70 family)
MDFYEKYKRLAHRLAKSYYQKFPGYREDLKSAALEGLAKGIAYIREHPEKEEYAGQIIYLNIRQYLIREIENIPLIQIPRSYIKKRKLECYLELRPFKIRDLYPEVFNDPDLSFVSKVGVEGFYHIKLKEIVEDLKLNDQELDVLDCRLADQTIREVAEELKISKSKAQTILERIRKKWFKKYC